MMYLWIAVGSALGGIARYWLTGAIVQRFDTTFPWETLVINILGSFIIGAFSAITSTDGKLIMSPEMRQFVMVGLCGGYTTFSTFSLQTLFLLQDGEFLQAGCNVLLSVILCLIFVWAGHLLAALFNQI